jgi:hypothetical protein
LGAPADGAEQIVERLPQRVVIVDHRNQRHSGHAAHVSLPSGGQPAHFWARGCTT